MKAWFLAVAVAPALAAPPPLYTLELWLPKGEGLAYARTLGPMAPDRCDQALAVLKKEMAPQFPPTVSERLSTCATQWEVAAQLTAYHCTAISRTEHGTTVLWIFRCAVP